MEGDVTLQIMAIYSSTSQGSVKTAFKQLEYYSNLLKNDNIYQVTNLSINNLQRNKLGMIGAIENASCLCVESDSLESTFKNLETILDCTSNILYIGLTHHSEN